MATFGEREMTMEVGSTFSQGEIGVAASSIGNPTEVVFTNAKV